MIGPSGTGYVGLIWHQILYGLDPPGKDPGRRSCHNLCIGNNFYQILVNIRFRCLGNIWTFWTTLWMKEPFFLRLIQSGRKVGRNTNQKNPCTSPGITNDEVLKSLLEVFRDDKQERRLESLAQQKWGYPHVPCEIARLRVRLWVWWWSDLVYSPYLLTNHDIVFI